MIITKIHEMCAVKVKEQLQVRDQLIGVDDDHLPMVPMIQDVVQLVNIKRMIQSCTHIKTQTTSTWKTVVGLLTN